MSEDWREGFHRALVDALVRWGQPLSPQGSTIRTRTQAVGIDYKATREPADVDWMEWQGTFHDPEHKFGLDLEVVLRDGTRHVYRYENTLSELIRAVLEQADQKGDL